MIRYTSRLPGRHLEALQRLMFFNGNQGRFRPGIVASVEAFGEPVVHSDGGLLRIHTRELGEVQALFAVEGTGEISRPVGVAVYVRNAPETITLVQISVDEAFTINGPNASRMVCLNLVQRVIDVARRIKGVRKVIILYGPDHHREIAVRRDD